ncbi:MAG: GNAT family N-acetyltransferase [Thermodesulfobacteriota bacterium]
MLEPPAPLTPAHDLTAFACGEPILDSWLRRHALRNERAGASRTYVVAESGRVAGYYALAAGSIRQSATAGRIRRNMPNPVPAMVLGRLAVDLGFQGRGLGRALLRDAVLRTLQAAHIAGIRALLVHALHERAARFYARAGFAPSPCDPLVLMVLLQDAAASLAP